METDLIVYDEVDSTNTVVMKLADRGAPEGTCVIALSQTKGQGRSGRSFFSPEGGNLYMSLLLRPDTDVRFDKITMAAAVAVSESIDDAFGIKTGIKWVNDIYHEGRKVCGIVAVAQNVGYDDRYVILGIGINIYAHEVPDDIAMIYGSIYKNKCDLSKEEQKKSAAELAHKIKEAFFRYYDDPSSPDLINGYREKSIVVGSDVLYVSGNDTYKAKAVGIDDDGGIILDLDGDVRSYRDGEIRIRIADT